MSTSQKVVILVKKSYLARIRGAIGSGMFRNLYARVDGEEKDIFCNGELSCALFVSTVLVSFHLAKEVHASVEGTIRDMERSGWSPIPRPRVGCIVVWERPDVERGVGLHIGFYVGDGQAISNSSKTGVPRVHSYRAHKVLKLYWTKSLE